MSGVKKKKSSLPILIFFSIFGVVGIVAFKVFGPNCYKDKYFYVHTGSDYQKLITSIKDGQFVADELTFDLMAKSLQLPQHIHPGKYAFKRFMSNYDMIKLLRQGRQTSVKLVINKLRTKADFINLVTSSLEVDSAKLVEDLSNPTFLAEFDLDTNTFMCMVIPDSYEFYWNTTLDKVFKKLSKNYTHFWSTERTKQAKNLDLTIAQVTTLASIVEEETNLAADKPNIASVYLNRLKKGMKLQADPTVKFAIGDFAIKRINSKMLQNPSAYNTYQHEGLPPGPICTPSPSTVDAVLQAPATNYIYFCAKADLSGASVFAATDAEHLKNARLYQKALNERGIH